MFRSSLLYKFRDARKQKSRRGISLVEMVVVIFIIAILATAVIGGTTIAAKKAKKTRAEADFTAFQLASESVLANHQNVANIATLTNKEKLEYVMGLLNKELAFGSHLTAVSDTIPAGGILKLSDTYDDTDYVICESEMKDPWKHPYYVIIDRQDRIFDDGSAEFYITTVSAGPNGVLNLDGAIDEDDLFLLTSFVRGKVFSETFDVFRAVPKTADGSSDATCYVIPALAPAPTYTP